MGRPTKFDYDSDEFYEEIFALALNGLNDGEIAYSLINRFGVSLDPDTFGQMKSGKYINWSKDENERRSKRLIRVLARGRAKINGIVRATYLSAALGKTKTKNKATVYRSILDDQNNKVGEVEVQRTESETELPPNMQALSTWLYHHDPEWRKVQRGQDTESVDIPTDIDQGVDIDAWIKKETETKTEEEVQPLTNK